MVCIFYFAKCKWASCVTKFRVWSKWGCYLWSYLKGCYVWFFVTWQRSAKFECKHTPLEVKTIYTILYFFTIFFIHSPVNIWCSRLGSLMVHYLHFFVHLDIQIFCNEFPLQNNMLRIFQYIWYMPIKLTLIKRLISPLWLILLLRNYIK